MSRRTLVHSSIALAAATALPGVHVAEANSRTPVNIDAGGLALRGYDPVAYFTASKPVRGLPEHRASFAGATYHFASDANRIAFEKEPARYAPQYGGFCAYAVANGYKADADPAAWEISGGRLFVNYNASVARTWSASKQRYIKDGDAKWAAVMSQPHKSGWFSWLGR